MLEYSSPWKQENWTDRNSETPGKIIKSLQAKADIFFSFFLLANMNHYLCIVKTSLTENHEKGKCGASVKVLILFAVG